MPHFKIIDPIADGRRVTGMSVMHPDGRHEILGEPDRDGLQYLPRKACFDVRRMLDLGIVSESDAPNILDVDLLHDGRGDLLSSVKGLKSYFRLKEAQDRISAIKRADRTVGMDVSWLDTAPHWVVENFYRARAEAIHELSQVPDPSIIEHDVHRMPTTLVLRRMEAAGATVDREFVKVALQDDRLSVHERASLRKMLQPADGILRARFNAVGTRTGRIGVASGFNFNGIPHGVPRSAIRSRFENGKISVFDFNAIDYRCIVRAVGGELAMFYEGCDDFHARTASILFGEDVHDARRNVVKYLTYIYVYGGSEETVSKKTGLSPSNVREAIRRLDTRLGPVIEFRRGLHATAAREGHVGTPSGRRVTVSADDHQGKVLGLFAQTYSSDVFEKALRDVDSYLSGRDDSVMTFTVYDELVVDRHPGFDPRAIVRVMEDSSGFRVKLKEGDNYGEATAD